MKTKSKSLMILLSLAFSLIAISSTQATINQYIQMIQNGITYLEGSQDQTTKLWGTTKETPFRDAAAVVDVLARLDVDYTVNATVLSSGSTAVHTAATNSTDYLARKIIADASVNGGVVDQALIDSLVNMQNDDGGWGYQKFYGSNNLETALAIQALVAASYNPSSAVFVSAGDFLVSSQHLTSPDYGWGFAPGGDSKVFYTAHVVIALFALQNYSANFDFIGQIETAFIYFQAMQESDGGFCSAVSSNAYETGLAIAAMIAQYPAADEIKLAWDYLAGSQLTNGSWNNDAYSTAMALYGLFLIDPYDFLYKYVPGDANMRNAQWQPQVIGADQTYLVAYLKGNNNGCLLDGFFATADVNGDCMVSGGDVTKYTRYFKGLDPNLLYCPNYPPAWLTPSETPTTQPANWPGCDARLLRKTINAGEPANPLENVGD
jgi:hypothetical protein